MDNFVSGVVGEYLAREFNGRYTFTRGNPTVTTGGGIILSRDPERVFVCIVNTGVNSVAVNFAQNAGSTNGVLLAPSGGLLSFNMVEDFVMPTLEFWARGISAASTVFWVTVSRYEPINKEGDNNAE